MMRYKRLALSYIKSFLQGLSEIFFLRSQLIGGLLLLILLTNPNMAIFALMSVVTTYLFASFINMHRDYLFHGFYTYNPLLVGLSLGYYYEFALESFLIMIPLSIMTFFISIALKQIFASYQAPILSLPFSIVSFFISISSQNFSNFLNLTYYQNPIFNPITIIPDAFTPFLKTMGAIIFSPYEITGLSICLCLLYKSRILLCLAIIGYIVGDLSLNIFTAATPYPIFQAYYFNFPLTAIAIGGVLNIPSLKSYVLSMLGVLMCAATIIILSNSSTSPVYALPFNLVVILYVIVLKHVSSPLMTRVFQETPEENFDYYHIHQKRFLPDTIQVHPPIQGHWTIYQSFDGPWTHQGNWKYALDFIKTDNNSSYKNEGRELEDYYAFGAKVYSPIEGYIVEAFDALGDNPIGKVDNQKNWGNYIIIKSLLGYYVEISHIAQDSCILKKGDYVEVGTPIALCGNSGYSPEPHIHMQVQWSPKVGSTTSPFVLKQYQKENELINCSIPQTGDHISNQFGDSLGDIINLILDQKMKYKITHKSGKESLDEFTVCQNIISGVMYLTDLSGNKLHFSKDECFLYFYDYEGEVNTPLSQFLISLPKFPLNYQNGLVWSDSLPLRLMTSKIRYLYSILLFSLYPTNYKKYRYQFEIQNKLIIKGIDLQTKVTIDFTKLIEIVETPHMRMEAI